MFKKVKIGTQYWVRVNRKYPCPICGKPDWCLFNEDQTKAVCMRKIDDTLPRFAEGSVYTLNGGNSIDFSKVELEEGEKMASAHVLHKVYSLVIDTLGLTKEHIQHLTDERGLTAEQIALRGYASATKETLQRQVVSTTFDDGKLVDVKTIWEDLFEANGLPKDAWIGVPGFSCTDTIKAPTFNTAQGILIPCRNDWGQIVGMQVRLDESEIKCYASVNDEFKDKYRVSAKKSNGGYELRIMELPEMEEVYTGFATSSYVEFDNGLTVSIKSGAKYVFVSSVGRTHGTAAKSRAHFAFPDDVLVQAKFDSEGKSRCYLMGKVTNVIVTEGLLKGDIIASLAPQSRLAKLGSVLVIAMAGVSSWRPVAKKILKYKFEQAFLAFDQDFVSNDSVFERLNDMVQYLTYTYGIVSNVFTWEVGKGFDDYLLSSVSNTEKIQYRTYTPAQ